MSKIPFHIVSGFLGSGKTTFLKQIIDSYSDKYKLGIIQNEFASANIDGIELEASGKSFEILKINKGSVFCVCLLGDFARSLEKFIDEYSPEILILETSGLSDTTSVSEIVSSGSLAGKIYLATNWCIVDCYNYSRSGLMKQRLLHQIRMADVILLNKADIFKDVEIIEKELKILNPFAEFRITVYCGMEFALGEATVSKYYTFSAEPMGQPQLNSMVIKSGRKTTKEQAIQFLQQWAPRALRIKGYFNLKNGNALAVQCVYENIICTEIPGSFFASEIIALSDQFTLKEWNQSFKGII